MCQPAPAAITAAGTKPGKAAAFLTRAPVLQRKTTRFEMVCYTVKTNWDAVSLSLSLTHTYTHTHGSVSTKGVLAFENASSKSTKVYWILSKFHAFDEVLLRDIAIQTSWTPCKWRREGGGPALTRHTSIRQCTISLSPQIFRGMYYYFHLTDEKSAYDYAASYQQG